MLGRKENVRQVDSFCLPRHSRLGWGLPLTEILFLAKHLIDKLLRAIQVHSMEHVRRFFPFSPSREGENFEISKPKGLNISITINCSTSDLCRPKLCSDFFRQPFYLWKRNQGEHEYSRRGVAPSKRKTFM
jgi:hypothetical protein